MARLSRGPQQKSVAKEILTKIGIIKPERTLTEAEEKKVAAKIRAGEENLAKRMARLVIDNPTGNIEKKELDMYKMKIGYFIKKLENAQISLQDTLDMDLWMYKACDDFQEAVRKGDQVTCEYVIEALAYGVVQGHKPVLEKEKERLEEVMAYRKKRLINYLKLVEFSTQIAVEKESIAKDLKRLDEKRVERNEKVKAIVKKINEQEEWGKAYDVLKGKNGDLTDLASSPHGSTALVLATEIKDANEAQNNIHLIREMEAMKKTKVLQYEADIEKTKIILDNSTLELTRDVNQDLQEMMDDVKHQMLKDINSTMQINATLSEFNDTMRELFNDTRVKEYMLEAVTEFDELCKLIDDEELSGDGGIRIPTGNLNNPIQYN